LDNVPATHVRSLGESVGLSRKQVAVFGVRGVKGSLTIFMHEHVTRNSLDTLLPFISKIINMSLKSGQILSHLKVAKLRPLLEKPCLDHMKFSNYRPISNLAFMGKAIEKSVANQLITHINKNNLNETFQSAYKQYHSTETALIHVHNDIVTAIDNRRTVILLYRFRLT